jgi:diguanylate cyclase (GGDEF)-like protein/PAS domain S-box-containing protein
VAKPVRAVVIGGARSEQERMERELHRFGFSPICAFVDSADAASKVLSDSDWDLVICAGAGCWDLPTVLSGHDDDVPPLIYIAEPYALAQAFPSQLYVETVDNTLAGLSSAVRRALMFGAERRMRRARAHEAMTAVQLTATLADSVSQGIIVSGVDGRMSFMNEAAERLLGWTKHETGAPLVHELIHRHAADIGPDASTSCPLAGALESGSFLAVEDDEFSCHDGSQLPVAYIVTPLGAGHQQGSVVIAFRDLSDRKRMDDELVQRTYRDPLTGLPNQALFRDQLSRTLLQSDGSKGKVAVMFVGIDRFHVINDGLGHAYGDQLLIDISRRLAASLGPRTVLARYGGDQFTVLLPHVRRPGDATSVAERLIEELRAPFLVGGREVFITACVGVVLGDPVTARPGDLLRDADTALHQAKAEGRARLAVYDPRRHTAPVNQLDLETDLWRALQRREVELYYQPMIDLRSGTPTGVEALIRWRHANLGLVSPDSFIPLAEEMGLMISIGRWVLEEACRQTNVWRSQLGPDRSLVVSVNLSAKEFQHPDLSRQVAGALRRTGLNPNALTLEITESILMEDAPGTLKTLRALKRLGVRLAIDDFGTGYSSLSYLRRFPVDTVKIDRSLVTPLRNDRRSTAIVRAVTALAHDLGMMVTAEGIETPLQRDCLRDVGCDLGQGFLFSPAVDRNTLADLLGIGSGARDSASRTA